MKYSLENSSKKNIIVFKQPKDTLIIKPKFRNNSIQASKITLIDSNLINYYASKSFKKKLNKLLKLVELILNSDSTDAGDTNKVFGELDKLRSILENEYKKFIKDAQYKEFLSSIMVAQKKLRDNYMQKLILENYRNNMFIDEGYEVKQGRGR